MVGIQDYMIHKLLKEKGGKATKKQIFEALADSEEARKIIEEKLRRMAEYRIILIEEDEVRLP